MLARGRLGHAIWDWFSPRLMVAGGGLFMSLSRWGILPSVCLGVIPHLNLVSGLRVCLGSRMQDVEPCSGWPGLCVSQGYAGSSAARFSAASRPGGTRAGLGARAGAELWMCVSHVSCCSTHAEAQHVSAT